MVRLPGIVSFILRSAAIGSCLGVLLAAGLVLTNAGGLGTLILETGDPTAPLLLMLLGFATLIGSLYTGGAIMTLPRDERAAVWRTIRTEPSLKREDAP
jgi:hypothetical protein